MSNKKPNIGVALFTSIGLAVGAAIGAVLGFGGQTGAILGLLSGAALDLLMAIKSSKKPNPDARW